MVENRNVNENEISLLEIWDMLWSHKWLIALCTLAAAVLMFVKMCIRDSPFGGSCCRPYIPADDMYVFCQQVNQAH